MANRAAKKAAQNAAQIKELYSKITMGVNAFYFLFAVILFWSSFSYSSAFVWLFFWMVSHTCMGFINQSAELGISYSTSQDILFINWAVQVLSVFSSYFFYLYLTIPAYFLYSYHSIIWGYIRSWCQGAPPPRELTEKEKKKLEKKERQAGRVKYRSSRR